MHLPGLTIHLPVGASVRFPTLSTLAPVHCTYAVLVIAVHLRQVLCTRDVTLILNVDCFIGF